MAAAAIDRRRLASVLGMLGSAHDGEVLAAARQAERLRHEAGMTWADILTPPAPPNEWIADNSVADVVEFALDHGEVLSKWEVGFLRSIRRQRSPLSPKQAEIIERLVDKARRAGARAA